MYREPNDVTRMAGFAFGISAVLAIATLLCVCAARAHMKDRPDLDGWFHGLQSSGGFPCCSEVDGYTLPDVDWDTAVADGKPHYRVHLNGRWIVVSDEEVVEGPNKYGSPLVWIYYENGEPFVRCFMPGARG
jgi:hypothetical protein